MRSHGLFHYVSNLRGIGLIKFYAYGSIEESSISFNAFFKIDGQIKTTNNIAADPDAIWDFLDLGEADLEKIRQICIHYEKPVPRN